MATYSDLTDGQKILLEEFRRGQVEFIAELREWRRNGLKIASNTITRNPALAAQINIEGLQQAVLPAIDQGIEVLREYVYDADYVIQWCADNPDEYAQRFPEEQ